MAYIGIDLGTTNTLVGIKKYQREPEVLTIRGEDISLEKGIRFFIPSVVTYKDGDLVASWNAIIGENTEDIEAKRERFKNVIHSIKRLMGRGYDEKDDEKNFIREQIKETWGYEVSIPEGGTEEDIAVKIGGVCYTPQEISAAILREAIQIAEHNLQESIEGAVITVPAYFNDKQRWATREAALMTGINVQRILSEPEASAKAFGLHTIGEETKTVLVYDLGGGTFDVTLFDITGTQFSGQDLDGNMWLGGDDFDIKIVKYVLEQLNDKIAERIWADRVWRLILKERAKVAKERLSDFADPDKGVPIRLQEIPFTDINEIEITRRKFEEIIEPMIDKTIILVRKILERQACEPDDIDKVLLVGGSTRIPLVKERLAEIFGEDKLVTPINPMKAVAEGAAIESSWLLDKIECPICGELNKRGAEGCRKCNSLLPKTIEPTERPYGVEIHDPEEDRYNTFKEIIPKGRKYPIPIPAERSFKIDNPEARILKVRFFAGEKDEKTGKPYHENIEENTHLGTIWVVLPKDPGTEVKVRFNLSDDRILEDVSIECRGKEVKKKKIVRESKEERICTETEELLNYIITELGDKIDSKKREELIQLGCDAFELVIRGDYKQAEAKNKELKEKSKISPPPPPPPPPPVDLLIKAAKSLLNNSREIRKEKIYGWLPYFKSTVEEVMMEDRWRQDRQGLWDFYVYQSGTTDYSEEELLRKYGERTIDEMIAIAERQLETAIQRKDIEEINLRMGILDKLLTNRAQTMLNEISWAAEIAEKFTKEPIPQISPRECQTDKNKLQVAGGKIVEFLKHRKIKEAEEEYRNDVEDLLIKYIIAHIIAQGEEATREKIEKQREKIITGPRL